MKNNLLLQTLAVGLLAVMLCVTPVPAQWSSDPNINNAICTATGGQDAPQIVTDGRGGFIVAWEDHRGSDWDIYAQRVDALGNPSWTANGVAICTATGDQTVPDLVSDGLGGAIIIWYDRRGSRGDIFAQHIDASGNRVWPGSGVAISAATGDKGNPTIVSDDSGGAIIAWQDSRAGSSHIYAQRVTGSGAARWTTNGVGICTATGDQARPMIVTDGSGGAIITWSDRRDVNWNVYAQRVNASGLVQWTTDGVAICTMPIVQESPSIVYDGSGGAIITWEDWSNGDGNIDIYAQSVNASGNVRWWGGIAVCTAAHDQAMPRIVSDGSGGAIISWMDRRNGSDWDIYAERVNASGLVQWTTDGIAICTATGDQNYPSIVSDGSGGAIITWEDLRAPNYNHIYAQCINAFGVVQWTADGAAICTARIAQFAPVLTSDGSGGAVISWADTRNNPEDIYAQKVDRFGYLGDVAPRIVNVKDVVNDQGGKVTVSWNPSYFDVYPNTTIKSYYVFRGVSQAMGMKSVRSAGDFLKELAKGRNPKNVLLKTPRPSQGAEAYYWEYVDSVRALRLPGYSYKMPTASDSGPQGTAMCYAMVMARTGNELLYWFSIPDSGYSVDNLSPSAVASIAAEARPGPSVNVHWSKDVSDPDVGTYEVHRSAAYGFIPDPSTKIGQTTDTTFVDVSPDVGAICYYRVVTVDIHGNRSAASRQATAPMMVTNRFSVSTRWNLVSVPLTTADYRKSALYPTAISSAFGYDGGYVEEAVLANGVGYWLKFNSAQDVPMTGYLRLLDSIAVQQGWNMIGSISVPVAVTNIGSSPGGIITSQFFGYSSGYRAADLIEPGKGYWVKVRQGGRLILASAGEVVPAARITMVSDGENPPAPPDGDASSLTSGLPDQFALDQNCPNPFNPTTNIGFRTADFGFVTLQIIDPLGQVVATLLNGWQNPGEHIIRFDGSYLSSGVYFYRLDATSASDPAKHFSRTRKMLLVR